MRGRGAWGGKEAGAPSGWSGQWSSGHDFRAHLVFGDPRHHSAALRPTQAEQEGVHAVGYRLLLALLPDIEEVTVAALQLCPERPAQLEDRLITAEKLRAAMRGKGRGR